MSEDSIVWETRRERPIGVSLATVRRWRLERRGPRYRKIRALVRYSVNDRRCLGRAATRRLATHCLDHRAANVGGQIRRRLDNQIEHGLAEVLHSKDALSGSLIRISPNLWPKSFHSKG